MVQASPCCGLLRVGFTLPHVWLALFICLDTKAFSQVWRNAIFAPFPMEFQYFNAYTDKNGAEASCIIFRFKGTQGRRP
jgi:hypothetical protein